MSIRNEAGDGNTTVKGYEPNMYATKYYEINSLDENGPYWIVLGYTEGLMLYFKNNSNRDVRIYSRGATLDQTKNMFVNRDFWTSTGTYNRRNTGSYYYTLGAHSQGTLILYATRDGWVNVKPI